MPKASYNPQLIRCANPTCGKLRLTGKKRDLAKDHLYCSTACARLAHRKIEWPNPMDMWVMVWKRPIHQISKELGVSDVAVRKYCFRHGVRVPRRGYWAKKYAGVTLEAAAQDRAEQKKAARLELIKKAAGKKKG